MGKVWDDFSKWVDDASRIISREAGDLTSKGKLKIEIFDLKWRLKDQLAEFGRVAYEQTVIKKNERWQSETPVKNLIAKIKVTMKNLKARETDYRKVGK
jgi:hypothetical protein